MCDSGPLKRYSNIFGAPGEGGHSKRLFGIAIVDLLLTAILAWFIAYFAKLTFWVVFGWLWLTAIFLHALFGVPTALNCFLFGRGN